MISEQRFDAFRHSIKMLAKHADLILAFANGHASPSAEIPHRNLVGRLLQLRDRSRDVTRARNRKRPRSTRSRLNAPPCQIWLKPSTFSETLVEPQQSGCIAGHWGQ